MHVYKSCKDKTKPTPRQWTWELKADAAIILENS
jgi:hypothetical protein